MKRLIRRLPDVIGISIALITVISIATSTSASGSSALTVGTDFDEPRLQTLVYQVQPEPTQYLEIQNLGEYTITAYCSCEKCCEEYGIDRPIDKDGNTIVYTASGSIATQGITIAADPSIFPYGTHLMIDGHIYTVQDCGGSIKGKRLDIYFDNHQEALNWGVQKKTVYIERSTEK